MRGFKRMMTLMMALLMAFTLASCGSQPVQTPDPATPSAAVESTPEPATPTPDQSTPEPAQPIEIVYARGMDVSGANDMIIEEFNKRYEGKIKVTYVEMPTDTGKQHDAYVTSFAAGGSEYDVVDIDVIWPAEFAQAGYALALDRYVERDGINLDDYMDGPVAAVTFKGKLWAMPKFIDAGMFFYRSDIVEGPPETWDDMIEQARTNMGKEGTKFGYLMQGKQYEGMVCNAVEFISAYGGAVVDGNGDIIINSPETIKGLEKMKEIVTSDIVPNNITTFTEPESHTSYIEGQSVYIRNWPYQWGLCQDPEQSKVVGKVGISPLPKGDVRSASCLGGWLTMINRNSENPDAAWEFVKFMTGPEGQKITAMYGGNPPTYLPLYDDAEVIEKNPYFGEPGFLEGLKAAVPRPVSPIYPKLSEIMQIEISKIFAGEQTVEEAVRNMDEQMKAAVEEAQ